MMQDELTASDIEEIEQVDVTNEELLDALAKYASGAADETHFAIEEARKRVMAEQIGIEDMVGDDHVASFSAGHFADEDGVVDRLNVGLVVDGVAVELDAEVRVA